MERTTIGDYGALEDAIFSLRFIKFLIMKKISITNIELNLWLS